MAKSPDQPGEARAEQPKSPRASPASGERPRVRPGRTEQPPLGLDLADEYAGAAVEDGGVEDDFAAGEAMSVDAHQLATQIE